MDAEITRSISLPENGLAVIQSNDQFAFDFLHAALQTDQTVNNKLISPLSIYLALSMVYNGAANATRDSIENVLRADNIRINDLNKTAQAMIQGMPLVDNQITLSLANSIWYNQSIQPLPLFLNLMQQYYLAKMEALNFADPQSVNTINQWIADNTDQKITKVLDNVNPDDLMYLINALYFKGTWKYGFDPKATSQSSFYLSPSKSISTPFMTVHTKLNYFQNDSLQILQLPYGSGDFNMYVLSPSKHLSMADFTMALNPSSFNNWKSELSVQDIQLSLPKFQYSYSINDMEPPLAQMGMEVAFTHQADFSNMYPIPANISKAIHKTYIAVDEQGTEATAVTVIGITSSAVGPSSPIFVNINHPFFYIIQEKTSGAILFMGLLNDPQNN